MLTVVIAATVVGAAAAVAWTTRCRWGWHGNILLTQKRDPTTGRVIRPHVIVWECQQCGHPVSETALVTNWRLQADLRRQPAATKEAEIRQDRA